MTCPWSNGNDKLHPTNGVQFLFAVSNNGGASTAIIGGADGPTSVLVASVTARYGVIVAAAIAVIVAIIGICKNQTQFVNDTGSQTKRTKLNTVQDASPHGDAFYVSYLSEICYIYFVRYAIFLLNLRVDR